MEVLSTHSLENVGSPYLLDPGDPNDLSNDPEVNNPNEDHSPMGSPWPLLPLCLHVARLNSSSGMVQGEVDPRICALKQLAYGVALPLICCLGVIGNVLNLVVLTRRNMKGAAYIYMRGYAAASLLAILFAIPFGLRVVGHREAGLWTSLPQAFFHAHLELFLGNACLGVGVLMLLALTVERYAAVCQLKGGSTPHRARLAVAFIPVLTFLLYLPNAFRAQLSRCVAPYGPGGTLLVVYQKRDNTLFLQSTFYSVYKVLLEVVFKVGPTLLLAGLNARILIVYRRSCARRRKRRALECRQFAEERRLAMLLGSTSLLFFACVSPMVILNVTLNEGNLTSYAYQVFRAVANVLEVTNYSITFYIYCLFSEDFRNTLIRTVHWPWCGDTGVRGQGGQTANAQNKGSSPPLTQQTTPTPTPPRATVATSTTGTHLTVAPDPGNHAADHSPCLSRSSGTLQKLGQACGCLKMPCLKVAASPAGSSADRVIV